MDSDGCEKLKSKERPRSDPVGRKRTSSLDIGPQQVIVPESQMFHQNGMHLKTGTANHVSGEKLYKCG